MCNINCDYMNKPSKKDVGMRSSDEFKKAADTDTDNFRVHLNSLDIERTLRIYKSIVRLSSKA